MAATVYTMDRLAAWSSRRLSSRLTLRSVSNRTSTPASSTPNVFAATLQDSPFIRRRKSEHGRSATPWIAGLLKSFFVNQWQRQINSAHMYESCAKQALHSQFYTDTDSAVSSIYQLEDTFATNLELTSIHVWICKTRITSPIFQPGAEFDQAEARLFLQQLLERMWEHITRSLTGAGAHDIRLNKFLKEIQDSVFGSFIAYDQAFARILPSDSNSANQLLIDDNDGVIIESFSTATMSNFFGPAEAVRDASTVRVARALAYYMVRQLRRLQQCSDEEMKSAGYSITWEDPGSIVNDMMMKESIRNEIRPLLARDQPAI